MVKNRAWRLPSTSRGDCWRGAGAVAIIALLHKEGVAPSHSVCNCRVALVTWLGLGATWARMVWILA